MWGCNHRAAAAAAGSLQQQHVGACRAKAGIIMALCPVVIIAGLLPSLLFFQSCFAVPPPLPEDWEKVRATVRCIQDNRHHTEPSPTLLEDKTSACWQQAAFAANLALQDATKCSNA
jgi:hypothetical protein